MLATHLSGSSYSMVFVNVDFEVDFALRGICDAKLNNL